MQQLIYIADDEKNIRELLCRFLESGGYKVCAFETGDALMEAFVQQPADLVILDIMMQGHDGLSCCRMMREYTDVPIILLTAKDSEPDYIAGISLGSDDYLTKPFRPTVLLMRVKALLRRVEMSRHGTGRPQSISVGDLRCDPDENAIFCGAKAIAFTQNELKMLTFLMQRAGKATARSELLEKIWGYPEEVATRVTDETLRRIRKKLAEAGSSVSVETVWGYGYRLQLTGEAQ